MYFTHRSDIGHAGGYSASSASSTSFGALVAVLLPAGGGAEVDMVASIVPIAEAINRGMYGNGRRKLKRNLHCAFSLENSMYESCWATYDFVVCISHALKFMRAILSVCMWH